MIRDAVNLGIYPGVSITRLASRLNVECSLAFSTGDPCRIFNSGGKSFALGGDRETRSSEDRTSQSPASGDWNVCELD